MLFFSSPWAFERALEEVENEISGIPNELKENLRRWKLYEQYIVDNIVDALDAPDDYSSRIVRTTVSYTHLDVYKRQLPGKNLRLRIITDSYGVFFLKEPISTSLLFPMSA